VSPVLLAGLVLAGLMAQKLVDIYRGGHYVCPACGARDQGLHTPDCPWSSCHWGSCLRDLLFVVHPCLAS
jgi:hypothetical protein